MFNLIKAIKKENINCELRSFSFGHYYDGKDHNFSYPAVIVTIPREFSGKDTAAQLEKLEKIKKKFHVSAYDKGLTFNDWYIVLLNNDDIEQGRKEYSECIAFQYGFWMKRHEKPDASDEELIAAGHAAMQEKGYTIRVA